MCQATRSAVGLISSVSKGGWSLRWAFCQGLRMSSRVAWRSWKSMTACMRSSRLVATVAVMFQLWPWRGSRSPLASRRVCEAAKAVVTVMA